MILVRCRISISIYLKIFVIICKYFNLKESICQNINRYSFSDYISLTKIFNNIIYVNVIDSSCQICEYLITLISTVTILGTRLTVTIVFKNQS